MTSAETPGGLVDALMSGDLDYLCDSLSKIDRIDGEPLELLAALLDGDLSLRATCDKKIGFSPWVNGQSSSTGQQLLPIPEALYEALALADNSSLATTIRHIGLLEGNSLNAIHGLVKGDDAFRSHFPQRLNFIGWRRGRPSGNSTLRDMEERNLGWVIERRLKRGDHLKAIMFALKKEYGLGRSTLMRIRGEWKARHRD